MRKIINIFFIFVLFFSTSVYAFDRKGFSPTSPYSVFSTFSAETPKQNQLATDFSFEFATDPDIKRLNLNISYGLTNRLEVIANLPYNLSYQNSKNKNGSEDLNLGFKHRLLDETRYLPAFAYLLYLSGDLGKEEFSTQGGFGGGIIVTKKLGPVTAHGNLIYFNPFKKGFKDTWSLNLSSELKVSYNSAVLFEIIGRKAIDKDKIELIEWRVGYRIKVTDISYTTVGVGFDIKNRSPDARFLFGVSVILPKEKRKLKKVVEDVH
ncbi:MAG: hypothetical protein ABDH16_08140 [Thermodesulfovibrionaceae bacterium]